MSPPSHGSKAPILIVPYQWIGDFVRGHSVVKLLKSLDPSRPIDILASSNAAPLADYMPGVRKAIVVDLPRASARGRQAPCELAKRLARRAIRPGPCVSGHFQGRARALHGPHPETHRPPRRDCASASSTTSATTASACRA